MVGEAGEGSAVFLRLELLCMSAGLCVVDVESVVGAGEEQQFARRVEIERGVVQVGRFKQLSTCQTVGETCIGYLHTHPCRSIRRDNIADFSRRRCAVLRSHGAECCDGVGSSAESIMRWAAIKAQALVCCFD